MPRKFMSLTLLAVFSLPECPRAAGLLQAKGQDDFRKVIDEDQVLQFREQVRIKESRLKRVKQVLNLALQLRDEAENHHRHLTDIRFRYRIGQNSSDRFYIDPEDYQNSALCITVARALVRVRTAQRAIVQWDLDLARTRLRAAEGRR